MKKIILFLIPSIFITAATQAQIKLKEGVWSPIGNTTISMVSNDPDGGDKVADGGLWVNGNVVENGQGVVYTFDGTMKSGKTYKIDTYLYNFGVSYSNVSVSLYNKTTNTELVSSPVYVLKNLVSEKAVNLSYTATPEDKGCVLELKYIRSDDGGIHRDFYIDNAKLNGSVIPFSTRK